MNKLGFRPQLCIYIDLTGPVEPPEDGEMNKYRNSSPGGLRPSTLPLNHGDSLQYCMFMSEQRRNVFLWNLNARGGGRTRAPRPE